MTKKPSSKTPNKKRDYFEVVVEDIRVKFDAIGEGYKTIDQKLDRLGSDFGLFREEIRLVKSDIGSLRLDLKDSASLEKLHQLEDRVQRLERRWSAHS